MVETDHILLSVTIALLILAFVWVIGSVVVRKLGLCCMNNVKKEDEEAKEIIQMDDEAYINYSYEIVQPELKNPTRENSFADNKYNFFHIKVLVFENDVVMINTDDYLKKT
jgi:hypothetical protein